MGLNGIGSGLFVMHFFDFLPYIVALAIACVIPGPGVTASVGTALGAGFRRALVFVTGIVIGDLCYLTFAVLGMTAIASAFSGIFVLIKFAGGAYLLYLAWKFWHGGVNPASVQSKSEKGSWATLLGGLSLTLGNPKTIIFYMALLPTVVDLHTVTLESYLLLVLSTIGVIYSVCIPYIGLASRARTFLSNPRALKWLGRGAGSAMASAALFVIVRE